MALIDSYAVLGSGAPCETEFGKAELLKRMEELGITHSIVVSSLAISSDFERGNAWLDEQIQGESKLLGYAVANVNHPAQAVENMRHYLTRRQFAGLLLVQGDPQTPVNMADAEEVLNAYRRYAKPLLISAPNRECVYAAVEIAEHFDLIKVVLIGMGGRDWRSAIAAAKSHLNICLSTTGEISPDKVREGFHAVNGNRIVFGSNTPTVDPAVVMGMVAEAALGQRDLAKLLGGNAESIFAS